MVWGNTNENGISASNGGMILIVEDDDRISRLERFVLEQVGYRVTCAGTGEEALELLPTLSPSLVVLDVMLPQMDGFTTCQKIRETSQVPIVMVTCQDGEDDKVRGLEVGADDYITKPFSTHELASRVKSVLRRTDDNRDHGSRANDGPAFVTLPKSDMSFLHSQDEEVGFPTRAPLSGAGPLANLTSTNNLSVNNLSTNNLSANGSSTDALSASIGDPEHSNSAPAIEENYEGAVKLVVETKGAVRELIRFVDFLRENRQIHLLRLVSNTRRDGMDVWLRLRSPNPLRATLLAAAGVSQVEVAEPSKFDPQTPVLMVSLD